MANIFYNTFVWCILKATIVIAELKRFSLTLSQKHHSGLDTKKTVGKLQPIFLFHCSKLIQRIIFKKSMYSTNGYLLLCGTVTVTEYCPETNLLLGGWLSWVFQVLEIYKEVEEHTTVNTIKTVLNLDTCRCTPLTDALQWAKQHTIHKRESIYHSKMDII